MLLFGFTIPGSLPNLNDMNAASRTNYHVAAKQKREVEEMVTLAITSCRSRVPVFERPVSIAMRFYEANRRRDPDNISATAHKFILDALVHSGVIAGDGWKHLAMPSPFRDEYYVDKDHPRIVVSLLGVGDN